MAKGNRTGDQAGLNAGDTNNGIQQAQRLNQKAAQRAGQANFEFGTELGAGTAGAGATGMGTAGNAANGVNQARQLNQKAAQNAARKADR